LLWRAQRIEEFLDLASAGLATREFGILNRALERNGGSPIAAAIAATTLLRCNALDEAERGALSKLDAFYNFPDGAVLTAEALMRKGSVAEAARQKELAAPGGGGSTDVSGLAQGKEFREARAYFAYLAQRGPPLLASTLSFAAARVPFWREVLEKKFLHRDDREELAFACDLVERTVPAFYDRWSLRWFHVRSQQSASGHGNRWRAFYKEKSCWSCQSCLA
jgi:hypothetical protein